MRTFQWKSAFCSVRGVVGQWPPLSTLAWEYYTTLAPIFEGWHLWVAPPLIQIKINQEFFFHKSFWRRISLHCPPVIRPWHCAQCSEEYADTSSSSSSSFSDFQQTQNRQQQLQLLQQMTFSKLKRPTLITQYNPNVDLWRNYQDWKSTKEIDRRTAECRIFHNIKNLRKINPVTFQLLKELLMGIDGYKMKPSWV